MRETLICSPGKKGRGTYFYSVRMWETLFFAHVNFSAWEMLIDSNGKNAKANGGRRKGLPFPPERMETLVSSPGRRETTTPDHHPMMTMKVILTFTWQRYFILFLIPSQKGNFLLLLPAIGWLIVYHLESQ